MKKITIKVLVFFICAIIGVVVCIFANRYIEIYKRNRDLISNWDDFSYDVIYDAAAMNKMERKRVKNVMVNEFNGTVIQMKFGTDGDGLELIYKILTFPKKSFKWFSFLENDDNNCYMYSRNILARPSRDGKLYVLKEGAEIKKISFIISDAIVIFNENSKQSVEMVIKYIDE